MPQAKTEKIEHYADALVAIGKASNALACIEEDVVHLQAFMTESEAVRRFLASASVETKGKRKALQEILHPHIHPLLIEFIILLLTAGDLHLLDPVAALFFEKAAEEHEHIAGELHIATALSEEHIASIEAEMGRILNKNVSLRPHIMPGILGGILVKVGDFIVDGTLDRQLEDSRQQLLA
jgi:F-type H+-transporting ATPase subunit delta